MRSNAGYAACRCRSMSARRHSASSASCKISPSSSCRPRLVSRYRSTTFSKNAGARFLAFSFVLMVCHPCLVQCHNVLQNLHRFRCCCYQLARPFPRRRPNCSMSQVAFGFGHLQNSSAQAAENCGPRKLSGSRAEKSCATAPFGHSNWFRAR